MGQTIAHAKCQVNSTRSLSVRYSSQMDVREIRLQRLTELLKEHDNNKAALARTLKKAPAQVSQWFSGIRTITEESARSIEIEAKRPAGWLDTLADKKGNAQWRVQEAAPAAYLWPLPGIEAARFFLLPESERQKIVSHAQFILTEWERNASHAQRPPKAAA